MRFPNKWKGGNTAIEVKPAKSMPSKRSGIFETVMVVLDASVALKWIFTSEEGEEQARRYRDRHISGEDPIAIPELFFYEIGNVLATKITLGKEAVAEAFTLLWSLDLEVFSLDLEEFLSSLALARTAQITLYDAAYIELARKLDCDFVTFDKKLFEKLKGLKQVRLL
jgi:predicted nucleic acid-binding protein